VQGDLIIPFANGLLDLLVHLAGRDTMSVDYSFDDHLFLE